MTLRSLVSGACLTGCLAPAAFAQTHAVKKTESVVRAVTVYEWTGDPARPTASRITPVSLFINGQFEDGGIYMARPVPFVLDRGTVFELEKAGDPLGTVELSYQRHLESGSTAAFADGWTAYGKFKPAAAPALVASRKSGPLPQVIASGGDRPKLVNLSPGNSSDNSAKSPDRSTAAGSGTTVSASPAEKPDPDRPTMTRRTDPPADTSDPDDPAERPTLKRRTPQEQKADARKKGEASVTGTGDLNDDPDRPTMHRGKPATRLDEQDIPPLQGVPANMQQLVGVSDARNRPEHTFTRIWDNDDEKADVTAKLQELARAKLAEYGDLPTPPAATPPPLPPPGKTPQTAAARARAKKAAAAVTPPPPPIQLTNESLRAYTLSYGGAATFVYTATSPGAANTTRYVSVVVQRDPLGSLRLAMSSATDSAHLDRAPWMRMIDAVDADASNRASLLFELRAQNTRQFALYRVIGAKAEQIFITETPE